MIKNLRYQGMAKQIETLQAEKHSILNAYNELLTTDTLHRLILENISDAVVVTDDAGKITYASPNTKTVLGLSCEQVDASGTIYCLLNTGVCDIQALLKGEADGACKEWLITEASGRQRVLSISSRIIETETGSVLYVMRDITPYRPAGAAMAETGAVSDTVVVDSNGIDRKKAEQAARENERRLALAMSATSDAIWEWNLVTQETYFSPRWYDMLGYGDGEIPMTFDGWKSLCHPDDFQLTIDLIQSELMSSDNRGYTAEFRMRAKDGAWVWIMGRGRVVERNTAGDPILLCGTNTDITERKNAETALRESEFFYRQILESIPGMVFTTRHDGYCDYQSKQWADYTGVPASEHLGDGWNRLLHPEDQPRTLAAWRAAVEGRAPYDLEYRVRRSDGVYEWFKVIGRPILDAQGRVVRWFGVAINIEAIKHAESSLRDSETRFRMVVENSWDGIHQLDLRTGRYMFMSPSRERLTGYRSEELIRSMSQFAERVHPEDSLAFTTYLVRIIAGEKVEKTIEYRWRVKSGNYRWFSDSRRAVFDENGRAVALIGVSRDITESKNILAELEKSKNELERTVAERTAELELRNRQLHELSRHTIFAMENDRKALSKEIHDSIGGSLSAIKMMLETRLHNHLKPLLPDEEITSFEQIIGYLVDTIKESKRISYHMRSLALDDFGLAAAIAENIKNFKQFYADIVVALQVDVSRRDIPDEITTVIYRIIQEALNNVGKHSGAGKVIVELTESDSRLFLKVEDDGCGFDVNEALNREQSMSGFGLRSMKERVEICNGTFQVVSEPGKGTILSASIGIDPSTGSDK